MDDAQLSRPAVLGPFGKLHAECKCVVDEATLEAFDKRAAGAGLDRSKFLRNLIYLAAHGKSFDVLVAEVADRRMRLALGEGLELAKELQALHVRGEVAAD
jgi:hypothetical protein